MSLINDAIKQANQANKQRAFAADQPETTAPAPASFQVAPRSETNSTLYLIGGVVVFILLGGLFLALAARTNSATLPEVTAGARPVVSPLENVPLVEPVVAAAPAMATVESIPIETPAPVIAVVAPEPAVASAPEPVAVAVPTEFPEMKLQGIYYRLNNPSVMINGRTLERGDLLTDHVRVVQIDRRSVTLEMNGQTRQLRMN